MQQLQKSFQQRWLGSSVADPSAITMGWQGGSIADPLAGTMQLSKTMNISVPTYTTTASTSSSYNAAQLLNR